MQRMRSAAVVLLATVSATALATPAAAAGAVTSAHVVRAVLQPDGSVATETKVTCPEGSTFSLWLAVDQEFESNGGYYSAVAYSEGISGTCDGKAQRVLAQTTPSMFAPFQRDLGRRPAGVTRTRPTIGHTELTVVSPSGAESSVASQDYITLR